MITSEIVKVFRVPRNRPMVWFKEYGYVPVAIDGDDVPVFDTSPPKRIGDDAIIHVEGQRRKVRLLRSHGMAIDATWLVDMGPA